jgi:SAM-dependent methyltransferase
MKFETIMNRLKNYRDPDGSPLLFLIPDATVAEMYRCIVDNKLHTCLELGTGYGTTSCIMAAAVEEIGGGKVVTIDHFLHQPVNAQVLKTYTGLTANPEVVLQKLGYNWYLADLIAQQTVNGVCQPIFDFCFLDGAHEWVPDALAVFLVAKLLKPGGWIVLDDVNFKLRGCHPGWQKDFGHLSDRELDACQVGMVYELVLRQHPEFCDIRLNDGRIAWARKRPQARTPQAFEALETQVARLQADLHHAQARIAGMESSKFWQMRKAWLKIKHQLGVDDKIRKRAG